jgi:hypothetical protein
MATREIPRDQWLEFLDGFSTRHDGWQVTVEVLGSDIGAQVEVRNLPLRGVSADVKGRLDRLEISAGTRDNHVTHVIEEPVQLFVKQNESGADEALEIVTKDGIVTLLRFRSAVRAESVDGII